MRIPFRRRKPLLVLDWAAIQTRLDKMIDLEPHQTARCDQESKRIQDYLEFAGIDRKDADSLYCVAVGVALVDSTCRSIYDGRNHLPTNYLVDLVMQTLVPMCEQAGAVK
jgi:hypothetical protein